MIETIVLTFWNNREDVENYNLNKTGFYLT